MLPALKEFQPSAKRGVALYLEKKGVSVSKGCFLQLFE